ncbi:MAG: hypothetical protein JST12_18110 [Armatimonadetes bacterium]|nr:hypothetical protein [Armatimonadota bacterium]
MRHREKMKRYEKIQHEDYLGEYRRNPRMFGPQLISTGHSSVTERLPQVIVPPVVDLDPTSETFGKLKFLVGLGDNWLV